MLQISKELDRFSLPAEVKQAVLDCVWPRQEEVRQSLVQNTAMISNAYLKDFDWKVKVSEESLKLKFATLRIKPDSAKFIHVAAQPHDNMQW